MQFESIADCCTENHSKNLDYAVVTFINDDTCNDCHWNKSIIYPPVGPASFPTPPVNPENTGRPTSPTKDKLCNLKFPFSSSEDRAISKSQS